MSGPIISARTLDAIVGGGQEEDVTAVGGTFDVIVDDGQEENVMSFNGGAWRLRLQPDRRVPRRDFCKTCTASRNVASESHRNAGTTACASARTPNARKAW